MQIAVIVNLELLTRVKFGIEKRTLKEKRVCIFSYVVIELQGIKRIDKRGIITK